MHLLSSRECEKEDILPVLKYALWVQENSEIYWTLKAKSDIFWQTNGFWS